MPALRPARWRSSPTSSCWRPSSAAGIGCLLAQRGANLLRVVSAAAADRHRRRRPAAARSGGPGSTIEHLLHERDGGSRSCPSKARCCCRCSSSIVAALFVTVAQRMGRELTGRPPLQAYAINLLGSLTGVARRSRCCRGCELPPVRVVRRRRRPRRCRFWSTTAQPAARGRRTSLLLASRRSSSTAWRAAACGRRTTASRLFQDGADTVVEVNNIFHQSMAPVEQKEYFYQWPYTVFGDTLRRRADPRRRNRHRRRRRRCGTAPSTSTPSRSIRSSCALGARAPSRSSVQRSARHASINDDARHFLRTTTRSVRPGRVRADRFADRAIELLRACGSRATCSPRSRSARSAIT